MTSKPLIAAILVAGLSVTAAVAVAGPAVDEQAGKAIYDAQCMICHGQDGAGTGPAGGALNPKPNDFTAAAWWTDRTDDAIMSAIRSGSPGTSMKGYNKLTREKLQNLIAYLHTFQPAK